MVCIKGNRKKAENHQSTADGFSCLQLGRFVSLTYSKKEKADLKFKFFMYFFGAKKYQKTSAVEEWLKNIDLILKHIPIHIGSLLLAARASHLTSLDGLCFLTD